AGKLGTIIVFIIIIASCTNYYGASVEISASPNSIGEGEMVTIIGKASGMNSSIYTLSVAVNDGTSSGLISITSDGKITENKGKDELFEVISATATAKQVQFVLRGLKSGYAGVAIDVANRIDSDNSYILFASDRIQITVSESRI